jgi:exonuclease III
VSRSSAEAEYRAVANIVAESTWLRQFLAELRHSLHRTTLVYCDNINAVYMSSNPVQHQWIKHIEIDLHFVRDRVALGDVRVLHVPTTSQYADIFNKGLPSSVFTEFRSQGTRGGVLVACRDGAYSVIESLVHDFTVSVKLQEEGGAQWWFTGVYGPHQDPLKHSFLQELRDVRETCAGPWVIAGDFNQIYNSEDKNNANINRAMMGRFRRLIHDLELKEIPLVGRKFTWSNERNVPTLVKLDHVFCTASWEEIHPDCILHSNSSELPDHCPLALHLNEDVKGKRIFHFESFWTKIPDFLETMATSW